MKEWDKHHYYEYDLELISELLTQLYICMFFAPCVIIIQHKSTKYFLRGGVRVRVCVCVGEGARQTYLVQ